MRPNLFLFFLLAGLAVQGSAQKTTLRNSKPDRPLAAKGSVSQAAGAADRPSRSRRSAGALATPAPRILTQQPNPADFPKGPLGRSIRLGWEIFRNTPRYASAYVGNRLSCSSCHLKDGTTPYASPLAGVPDLFPLYKKRAGRVITFEDRIQECFTRSENGRPLPYRSRELTAVVAYIQWLSRGLPVGRALRGRGLVKLPHLHGNPARGAKIYAKNCAVCHQADGSGIQPTVPPLWGPDSFNDGAGMSHVPQMAAFVRHNMPQTSPGSLTPQQAFDVAAYVESHPRPRFNPRYAIY